MKLRHVIDPATFAQDRLAFQPDPNQAVHNAFFNENSLTLVLAPTERQSAELVRKCRHWLTQLDIKPRTGGSNKTSILLSNGARIVGLPGRDDNIRGFSAVSLLLIDDAARVPGELYHSVRPMIADAGDSVPATECPRISPDFLEQERSTLPEHLFAQEYICQFSQSAAGLVNESDIEAAFRDELPPLFPRNEPFPACPNIPQCNTLFPYPYQAFFIGVDIGQRHDFTAIAILELLTLFTDEVTYERKTKFHFRLRHIDQIPLNTEFESIVDYLVRLVSRQDLLYGVENLLRNRQLVFSLALAVWRARRHTAPTAVPQDAFRYLTNPHIPGLNS